MAPRVIADISVSLDGYVTAPGADIEHGLGIDGEPIHAWVMHGDDVDRAVLEKGTERAGAVVMGRTLFDVVDGPHGWSEDIGFGYDLKATPPFLVVTHNPPKSWRLQLDFTFAPDPKTAIDNARSAAGKKDVVVMGGGSVIRQCVLDGLVDELLLHVSPIVTGGGTPLFVEGDRVELKQTDVNPSSTAIHVTYQRTD